MAQGLTPQHKKEAKTIQKWLKNSKAHRAHGKHAHARHIFVQRAHMRACGVQNPRACQMAHFMKLVGLPTTIGSAPKSI
jgi:hypothetical protein